MDEGRPTTCGVPAAHAEGHVLAPHHPHLYDRTTSMSVTGRKRFLVRPSGTAPQPRQLSPQAYLERPPRGSFLRQLAADTFRDIFWHAR